MRTYIKSFFFIFIVFVFFTSSLVSQNENRVSLGTSLDYGFGKNFNNYAMSSQINYKLFKSIRLAPTFSYFLNKDNKKMSAFALNCHYLFPKFAENIFSVMKNQDVCFYPIAGFYISNFRESRKTCTFCSADPPVRESKLRSNFGFNFGAGIEYEIPTLLPVLREMNINLEIKYQALDNYSRPLVSFGLLYDL